jgi:hypothetical protein
MAVLGLFEGSRPQTDYLHSVGAYGSIPDIPETTTNVQTQDWISQMPNYGALSSQASGLAGTQMAGEVPRDVIQLLQQQAAERGIATGMPGSDNANAAYLRALGLTSLGLQQQGIQNYANLLQTSPKTTTQTSETSNNVLKAIYEAAPSPYAAAMANLQAQQQGLGAGLGSGGGVRAPAMPVAPQPTGGMLGYGSGTPTYGGMGAGAYTPSITVNPLTNFYDLPSYNYQPAYDWATAPYEVGKQPVYWDEGQYGLPSADVFGTGNMLDQLYSAGALQEAPTGGYQPTSSGTMYTGSEEGYYG